MLQKCSGSGTESTDRSNFHKAPFLQCLPQGVSKVSFGFLKDPTAPMNSIPPVVNKVLQRRVAPFQKGAVLETASTSGVNRPELQAGLLDLEKVKNYSRFRFDGVF